MVAKGQSEKPKASRTKRKKSEPFISKTGIELKEAYCRKCMKMKKPGEFFSAVDSYLDSNGLMSLCKECISDAYVRMFQSEHTIERTMLRICRAFNIRYSEDALNATIAHLKTQNKLPDDASTLGIYKSRLMSTQKTRMTDKDTSEDFTFVEVGPISPNAPISDEAPNKDYLEEFWGKGMTYDDYIFLESEYSNFKQTNKADTYPEIVLLKLVCYKLLQIDKSRIEKGDVPANLIKELRELMQSLAISPDKANLANSGKSMDTFGMWIKDIEDFEPAEWVEDKSMFSDISNVEGYYQDFFVKPLKNFIYSSKDFTVSDEEDLSVEDAEGDETNGNESSALSE